MEFQYQKLTSDCIKMVENKQLVVDCRISELVDENVAKIICLDSSSKVDSYDLSDGEVLVKGKINYRLIYEDNNGEVRSINYMCDYEDSILSNNLSSTDKIIIDSDIKSVSSSGLDIIRLSAVVVFKVYKVQQTSIDVVTNEGENCYFKEEEIVKNDYVTTNVSSFNIEDEIELKSPIKDILMTDSNVNIFEAICGENKVTIKGEANVNLTIKDEEKIYTKSFNIPFNEEVESASSSDCVCYSKLNIDSLKVVLASDDTLVKVKLIVDSNLVIFKPLTMSVVSDMYSMENAVNVVKEKAYLDKFSCYKNYSDNVNVEATLKEALGGKIIDVICPKNRVASVKFENGEMLVDGVLSACLLYENEGKISSLNIESPYKTKIDDFDKEIISVKGSVSSIFAKLKTDNIIDIESKLNFIFELKESDSVEVVTLAEDKGELNINKSAISIIVIDKNESFFDVAKRLATTPEELKRQNPTLDEPLTTGNKLYYYRKLVKKYEAE